MRSGNMTATNAPAHREHGNGYYPSEAELRKARGNAIRLERYLVEGEYVTTQQMAERLGITRRQVSSRMRRERKRPGPLTWDGLAR